MGAYSTEGLTTTVVSTPVDTQNTSSLRSAGDAGWRGREGLTDGVGHLTSQAKRVMERRHGTGTKKERQSSDIPTAAAGGLSFIPRPFLMPRGTRRQARTTESRWNGGVTWGARNQSQSCKTSANSDGTRDSRTRDVMDPQSLRVSRESVRSRDMELQMSTFRVNTARHEHPHPHPHPPLPAPSQPLHDATDTDPATSSIMTSLSVPTTAALPSTQLIPATHPAVVKALQRLSRPSLLSLVLDWLDERNQGAVAPYLGTVDDADDDLDLYPPASSLSALRDVYTELQATRGSKRDVVDRIVEGDWRDGVSLYQLAMADMQYLYDHPTSQRWTALQIVRLSPAEAGRPPSVPRFHPATFLRNLQRELMPDIKAHYNLDRHATLPLLILRVFILESPYNTTLALQRQNALDSGRTFYVAFPDSSPYVYVSLAAALTPGQTSDPKSLRRLILEGIPKAFSKPRDRYQLESTGLSARNLAALLEKRGGGRGNASAGGWAVYAGEDRQDNPLNGQLPTPKSMGLEDEEAENQTGSGMKRQRAEDKGVAKRRKLQARSRFGDSALPDDGKGIERLDIRMQDPFPSSRVTVAEEECTEASTGPRPRRGGRRSTLDFSADEEDSDGGAQAEAWRPDVRITLQGQHVFAGVRRLVEEGIVDGEAMPGWMTGEESVSLGIVRDGRIMGFKGSGV